VVPNQLPPFPTDEQTLGLLWAAIHPDPEVAERSSVTDLCVMYSVLGGADAIGGPMYHPNDMIAALITEIRRLRGGS
jgi:hypothetical protein